MYTFREKSEINPTILHVVPRFNTKLFIISMKSKVQFRDRSQITWPNVDSSVAWFPYVWKGKANTIDSSTKDFFLFGWFFLYLLQSGCCSKYPANTTNFSILNLFLNFPYPFVMKHFSIFVTVVRSKFHCLVKFYIKRT